MRSETTNAQVQEAFGQLQEYLADQVAPLLVSDAVEILIQEPAEVLATGLQRWVSNQIRMQGGLRQSDLLFHAFKKLYHLGALGLLPREALTRDLQAVVRIVLEQCPPDEREALAASLPHLGKSDDGVAASVEMLLRPAGATAAAPAQAQAGAAQPTPAPGPGADALDATHPAALTAVSDPEVAQQLVRGLARFTTLLTRVESGTAPQAAPAADPEQRQVTSQLISAAAESARDSEELRQYLEQMRQHGFTGLDRQELLRTLGESVPDWAVPAPDGAPPPATGTVETMRRIVTMERDPAESLSRLHEMVQVGTEQLNSGNLGRAVKIFDLVEQMISDREVDPTSANIVRQKAHEGLTSDRLRELARQTDNHLLLRRALSFFPALRPDHLLTDLDGELDRQRRYLLLTLLLVHGEATRAEVLKRMEKAFELGIDGDTWKFLRNLIYLLRHIHSTGDGPGVQELDYVTQLSELSHPVPLVREAIGYFGAISTAQADKILILRLRQLEELAAQSGQTGLTTADLDRLLSAVIKALVHRGTAMALRTAVEHGLKQSPHLGDTVARLADLRHADLSEQPQSIGRLFKELKKSLPSKMLGFLRKGDEDKQIALVRALSGTRSPEVTKALATVARGYQDHAVAEAAAAALRQLAGGPAEELLAADSNDETLGPTLATQPEPSREIPAPDAPTTEILAGKASFEGDIGLFGLPNLLQNLAQAELTGLLMLRRESGERGARLTFSGGQLIHCELAHLQGREAAYELLECPFPGSFKFIDYSNLDSVVESSRESWGVMGLLMEGMRRYDELQKILLVAPDDAVLVLTGVRPTATEEEQDGNFLRQLWSLVKAGSTPLECGRRIPADSFRIRSTLSLWIKQGALKLAEQPADPA